MPNQYHARSPWVTSVGMAFSGTMRGSPLRRSLGERAAGGAQHRAIQLEGGTVVRPETDTLIRTAPDGEEQTEAAGDDQTEAEGEGQPSSYEGPPEELERQEQAGVALARAKLDRAVGRWSNVAGMPPIASIKRPYRPIDFGGKPGRREVSSLSDEPGHGAALLRPRLAASKSAAALPAEPGRWRPPPVEAAGAAEAERMVNAAGSGAAGGRQYRPKYAARVQLGTGARWWPGEEPSNRSDAAAVTYRLERALEAQGGIDRDFRAALASHNAAFEAVTRQVGVHCAERGELLARLQVRQSREACASASAPIPKPAADAPMPPHHQLHSSAGHSHRDGRGATSIGSPYQHLPYTTPGLLHPVDRGDGEARRGLTARAVRGAAGGVRDGERAPPRRAACREGEACGDRFTIAKRRVSTTRMIRGISPPPKPRTSCALGVGDTQCAPSCCYQPWRRLPPSLRWRCAARCWRRRCARRALHSRHRSLAWRRCLAWLRQRLHLR